MFLVAPDTGQLEPRGQVPTQVDWPRNLAVDPSGRYLLAASQNSDNISIFSIDAASGALTPARAEIAIDVPVCIVFRAAGT